MLIKKLMKYLDPIKLAFYYLRVSQILAIGAVYGNLIAIPLVFLTHMGDIRMIL